MKNLFSAFRIILLLSGAAFAQGNAFSFQGRLNDGTNPANGRYDLEFKLFDAVTGGTQIGPTVSRPSTILINGVFSTTLDFGAAAFQNPNSIFIEIAVKPFGSPNSFTILGPRQQLTVVPFASRSQNSTNADNSQNSAQLGNIAANEYITRANGGADFIRNSTTTQTNSNFNISGNGTVNGNLSVGGNLSLVGTQTIVGNSNLGAINISGNVTQLRAPYGLPKAMLYVQANGTIIRCYNGITGASTGNCGFTAAKVIISVNLNFVYRLNFGFTVADKFFVITPQMGGNRNNIGANFIFGPDAPGNFPTASSSEIFVRVFFTDVSTLDADAENPFMIVVY